MVETIKTAAKQTKHNIHTFLSNLWEFLTAGSMLVTAGYILYIVHKQIHGLDALMIVGVAAVITGLAGLGAFYRFLKDKE